MLGLLIRDKLNLEHFCGAPFVLSSWWSLLEGRGTSEGKSHSQ